MESKLFDVDEYITRLSTNYFALFFVFVAKVVLVCEQTKPDIQAACAVCLNRSQISNTLKQDLFNLKKVCAIVTCSSTQENLLTLKSDKMYNVIWHLNDAFAVHGDKKKLHHDSNGILGRCAFKSSLQDKK